MRRSLRIRVLVPLVLTSLMASLIGLWIVRDTFRRQLDEQMQLRGESIAHALDTMIRRTLYDRLPADVQQATLELIVDDLGRLPDVTVIVVVSGDPQRVVATTEREWRGVMLDDLPYERVQEDLIDAIETRRLHLHFHWDTIEYDVSWPLALHIEHRPRGESADGAIMLHLDARPVREQLRRAAIETMAALLGAILSVSVIMWWVTDRYILARLGAIESAIGKRKSGDEGVFAPPLGSDEIGRLSDELNAMLSRLDRNDAELRQAHDHLETLVDERTRELRNSHERLRQSDRLATVGTLASGIAHDLNSLLLPIRSQVRVLERIVRDDDAIVQITELKQTLQFLQQLADSMRLCALDPADDTVTDEDTDVDQWWGQVASLLERALRSRGRSSIRLVCEIAESLPKVMVAEHRLTQAVLNLFVNAGDACADSIDPVVTLRIDTDEKRSVVRFELADTGCGMSEEVSRCVFDPFFTTKKRGASSGLGLAMVKSIVETAGGRVRLSSQVGVGTTITLEFPSGGEAVGLNATEDAPHRLRVAVTLSDGRMEGFVRTCLAPRCHVVITNGECAPSSDVWVVDSGSSTPNTRREFLNTQKGARLVVIGETHHIEGNASLNMRALPLSFGEEELLRAVFDGEASER